MTEEEIRQFYAEAAERAKVHIQKEEEWSKKTSENFELKKRMYIEQIVDKCAQESGFPLSNEDKEQIIREWTIKT